MPTPAPLLAHTRVLGAAHRCKGKLPRDADVAANAFANFVETSLFDLFRQERIGNRGPCCANHVQHAASDLADHGIW